MSDKFSASFEDQIRAAMAAPAASDEFVAALRERLPRQAPAARPRRAAWKLTPLRAFSLGFLVLLLAAILVIGPQRVLAQVLDWLGYVPGVGIVDQEGGLRVLEAPVSQTRDGITVTIEDGLIDAERTRLTFFFDGIRQELKPLSEDEPGCGLAPSLLLPDGKLYPILEGTGNGGPSWMRQEFRYGTLPPEMNEIQVLIPCVPEVLPGAGPEDWVFTIRFVPAPQGFQVLPVNSIPSPTAPAPTGPLGLALQASRFVELADGYLIEGLVTTQSEQPDQISFTPELLRFTDAAGFRLRVIVDYDAMLSQQPLPGEFFWSVRTENKAFTNPVTISLDFVEVWIPIEPEDQPRFQIDLGDSPADGQVWQLDQTIKLRGRDVLLSSAEFRVNGDGTYMLSITMQADPNAFAYVSINDLDNTSQNLFGSGGADSQGVLTHGIGYDYLPTGVHRFAVEAFTLKYTGPWSTSLELPNAVPPANPVSEEQACIYQEAWYAGLPSLPLASSGLAGTLLVSGDPPPGIFFPAYSIHRLETGEKKELVVGGWGNLSPDGKYLVYSRNEDLRRLDVDTMLDEILLTDGMAYSPLWAPDSRHLAFIKAGDGIFLLNADGSGLRRLAGSTADMIGIAGWLPDSSAIMVSSITPEGTLFQLLSIETGAVSEGFVISHNKGGSGLLSPDGLRMAYYETTFGAQMGLYVSDLDGSNPRLIAESFDAFYFSGEAWSPDSRWLSVNMGGEGEQTASYLVEVDTCQLIQIDEVKSIAGWVP